MLNVFCMGLALTAGQGSPAGPLPIPPGVSEQSSFAADRSYPLPTTLPLQTVAAPTPLPPRLSVHPATPISSQQLPMPKSPMPVTTIPVAPRSAPALTTQTGPGVAPIPMTPSATLATPKTNGEPKNGEPKNGEPKKNGEEKRNGDEDKKNGDEAKKDDRGYFMRAIDKTWLGATLEVEGIKVDGWGAFSYNVSTRNVTNLPYTWNDRADSALFQQFWVNIAKPVDWEKAEVQHGFNVALLYGSDYRFTLIRGFLNNQLKNHRADPRELNGFEQNIYGGDIPIFTYNVFLPGVGGEGTEITVGRMFCQFGYESVMAPSTPLMSRSYAFNWAPPFFHVGVMATTKIDKNLLVKNMIVNGNDVFFDGSQEWRYAGVATLTTDDGSSSISLATSFGRGKFDAGRPSGPVQGITTIGLAYEPFGRNNMNVFDLVYTTKLGEKTRYAFEAIYGYQTDVPAVATGSAANFNGGTGTAHWCSIVNYLFHDFTDKWTGVVRAEIFNDYQGQRTGFEGTYYSATLGLQCRPCDEVLIRPEIRYDYNPYSRPFTGRHDIFVAGFDMIVKF